MNHNRSSVVFLAAIAMLLIAMAGTRIQAQGLDAPAPASILGGGFTYQGQLRRGGSPANATCDFQFSLWNAASGGEQKGTTLARTGVNVSNGLFTVVLDFGSQFSGDALACDSREVRG